MNGKSRLELTWIGKDNRPQVEPRVLLEDVARSYHRAERLTDARVFENRLIYGDNLLALKTLEQEFSGKVKCIYIDPPFNTGEAVEHYEDGLEHSVWLSIMRDRISVLHSLLHEEGTLFVQIDDNELAYLIAVIDEIFGRKNCCYVITFKQASATGHKAINPGCVSITNFILMYCKNKERWKPHRIYTSRERDTRYSQFIINPDDKFAHWRIVPLLQGFAQTHDLQAREARAVIKKNPDQLEQFVLERARHVIRLAVPDYGSVGKEAKALIDESRAQPDQIMRLERKGYPSIYLLGGQRILFYADKLRNIDGEYVAGEPLTTLWDDVLSNNLHNEGGVDFPRGKKPEALIKRCLEMSTEHGDWVLDSFAGSGTTGAVAHKMGRRWIMVELREHCHTRIIPRLKRVIDGADPSGVTKAVGWQGGGGFRYYRLAPSLLEKDRWGNWVINPSYNAAMLAEAVCKLMGFVYAPDDTHYWMQGRSSESDFIYVTTQSLTHDQLRAISEEVGEARTLLICCKAFRANVDAFTNLTVRKIPQAVLRKCEWGKDDYSLSVARLTAAEAEPEALPEPATVAAPPKKPPETDLFAAAGE